MAFITYPLNNIDYTAEDAELFHCTRTSGIWAEDSFPISVTGADNNVTIGKGIAWINNKEFSGKVAALKSAEVLDLGIADSTYPRIDVIAIQFNANNNATDVVIKKGTPATNPVRPTIVRTGAVYELYLASVYRPVGATSITASNITDLRMDKTVCGLMADSVTSVDTSAINAQVKALIANLEAEIEGVKDTSGLMFEADWVENGVIPIKNGGMGANNAKDALANLGGVSITKLWENASPTSAFLSQKITLDLSEYEYFLFGFELDTSKGEVYYQIVSKFNGSDTYLWSIKDMRSSYEPLFLTRAVSAHDSYAWFGNSNYKPFSQSTASFERNTDLIPVIILGLKGVK